MKPVRQLTNGDNHSWGLVGAAVAAVAASLCCLGPLVLMVLGISGAWIGGLTALEPYRPIFMVSSIGFLSLAFYRVYKKSMPEDCKPGGCCTDPKAVRTRKAVLWIVAALIVGVNSFPYVVPYLFGGDSQQEAEPMTEVMLSVQNMTCESCVLTLRKSLTRLDGVGEVRVTLTPPQAIVFYDPDKVSTRDMIEATTNAGYPSSVKIDGGM